MSWSPTLYVQFPNEDAARSMATALGADFPADGSIPTGNENYTLVAPIIEWITPPVWSLEQDGIPVLTETGEARPGYWAMLRLNADWPGYAAAMATLQAAGVLKSLNDPSNVFAE